jgi:hypothetical protein
MEVQYLDRFVRLPSTGKAVEALLQGSHDDWEMIDAERAVLLALVSTLKPLSAIEVGVYKGGSLGILAAHSKKVFALDIDPACEGHTQQFPNVEFIGGPSERTLPTLIDQIQASREPLNFVLIDAAHTAEGVRADIENILRYRPQQPLYIVMHDSFNPVCRMGIKEARWSANPYVHLVELDFTIGRLVTNPESPDFRQMWDGLALAVLLPEERTAPLAVHENEALLFQTALRQSVHRSENWWSPIVFSRRARRAAHLFFNDYSSFQAAVKRRLRWQGGRSSV